MILKFVFAFSVRRRCPRDSAVRHRDSSERTGRRHRHRLPQQQRRQQRQRESDSSPQFRLAFCSGDLQRQFRDHHS